MERQANVRLEKTQRPDLDRLFEFQLDEVGRQLAAFTPANYTDRASYVVPLLQTK